MERPVVDKDYCDSEFCLRHAKWVLFDREGYEDSQACADHIGEFLRRGEANVIYQRKEDND